jgi:MFS family permease
LLAWFVAASFFFYQYLLRSAPGLMVTELRSEFHLRAEDFASVASWYLYAYGLLQIPVGWLVDRWGIRRVLLLATACCMSGAWLFGMVQRWEWVLLSRVVMGVGSAAAFNGAIKIAGDYLPSGWRGWAIGSTLAFGTLAPVALAAWAPSVIDAEGWRVVFQLLAGLGVVQWLAIWCCVPTPGREGGTPGWLGWSAQMAEAWACLRAHALHPKILRYAVIAVGIYTPLAVMTDVWGTALMMEFYGWDRGTSARMASMSYIGITLSSPLLGWAADYYRCRDGVIAWSMTVMAIIFGMVLWVPMPAVAMVGCLLLLGVCCGAEMLCFGGVLPLVALPHRGMVLGLVNSFNMLGGAALNQWIGYLLDEGWAGRTVDGMRLYAIDDYRRALMTALLPVMACCVVLAWQLARRGSMGGQDEHGR